MAPAVLVDLAERARFDRPPGTPVQGRRPRLVGWSHSEVSYWVASRLRRVAGRAASVAKCSSPSDGRAPLVPEGATDRRPCGCSIGAASSRGAGA